MRVCNIPGCPALYDGTHSRCPAHRREARAARVDNNVYSTRAHRAFREAVLQRDPICVHPGCWAQATVADHYPLTRRELVAQGLDPNDEAHGRGLCATHHNTHTARTSPGGWNARP